MMLITLRFSCPNCGRPFNNKQAVRLHQTRWCTGNRYDRSRRLTRADVLVTRMKQMEEVLKRLDPNDDEVPFYQHKGVLHEIAIEAIEIYLGQEFNNATFDIWPEIEGKNAMAWTRYSEIKHIILNRFTPHRLKKRLVKVKIHTIMLYPSETWPVFCHEIIPKLRGFSTRMASKLLIREITPATLPEIHTYAFELELADQPPERKLRWLGHLARAEGPLGQVLFDAHTKAEFFSFLPVQYRTDATLNLAQDWHAWFEFTSRIKLADAAGYGFSTDAPVYI